MKLPITVIGILLSISSLASANGYLACSCLNAKGQIIKAAGVRNFKFPSTPTAAERAEARGASLQYCLEEGHKAKRARCTWLGKK